MRSSTLQVTGVRVIEETVRRHIATLEPFTFNQETDDDKVYVLYLLLTFIILSWE